MKKALLLTWMFARPSAVVMGLTAGMLLTGCAVQQPSAELSPDSPAYTRKIMVEKVDTAVQALRTLASTAQESKAAQQRKQAALDDDEVEIDYVGKPQPLLESMAYRYGYKYVETGKRGELRTISLRVKQTRVIEVLRDIGLQIDTGADVVLDKDAKVIRLIYKKG